MKILLILAHPDAESLNHAIASVSRKTLTELGHQVIFHDLCKENFNPVLPAEEIPSGKVEDEEIARHCRELSDADALVVIHPNWWGMPPAIMKGWIDRVLRPGVAYKFNEGDPGEGIPVGLLKAKTAIVFNTSNTNREREENIFLDPLETLWKNCIFYLCGIKVFYRKMFRIVCTSTEEKRKQWLEEVESTLVKYFS